MTAPVTRRTVSEPGTHASRQEMYEELCNALQEALWAADASALDGFMDAEVLRWIASTDIPPLWSVCWQSWQHSTPAEHIALGTFIALMKAWYPWLQMPTWVMDVDPEAL